jgi:large repetitive protein
VTLTIDPLNDNPVAVADTFTVNEDGSLDTTPLANDWDADAGDVFTLNSVNPAINGTAVMSGNLVIYTPNPNYCGTDTFQYTIVDLSGAISNAGSVTMTVTCMNDAPAAASGSYTMTGNVITNSGSILYGTLSGSDIDVGDILTYNIVQNVLSGTLILTGSAFSYEPDIDFTGSDMFTFNVTDTGGLTSSTVTVNITVLPNDYNTAPVAYSGSFTINEDTGITNTLSGSDAE